MWLLGSPSSSKLMPTESSQAGCHSDSRVITGQLHQPISRPGCAESGLNERPPGVLVRHQTAGCDSPGRLNWPDTVKWPVILPVIERQVPILCFIALLRWILCKNYLPDSCWPEGSDKPALYSHQWTVHVEEAESPELWHLQKLLSLFMVNCVISWRSAF